MGPDACEPARRKVRRLYLNGVGGRESLTLNDSYMLIRDKILELEKKEKTPVVELQLRLLRSALVSYENKAWYKPDIFAEAQKIFQVDENQAVGYNAKDESSRGTQTNGENGGTSVGGETGQEVHEGNLFEGSSDTQG